jgi:hypothetical protein
MAYAPLFIGQIPGVNPLMMCDEKILVGDF